MIVVRIETVPVFNANDKYIVVLSAKVLASLTKNFALPLERIPCIHHLVRFKNNQIKIQALLDSNIKVNTMLPAYMAKLSLELQTTDVKTQKIELSILKTFEMVLANF